MVPNERSAATWWGLALRWRSVILHAHWESDEDCDTVSAVFRSAWMFDAKTGGRAFTRHGDLCGAVHRNRRGIMRGPTVEKERYILERSVGAERILHVGCTRSPETLRHWEAGTLLHKKLYDQR